MVERFLLDGVYMDGDGPPVNEAAQFALNVHAGPAPAALALPDETPLGAEKAPDNPAFVLMRHTFDAPAVALQAALGTLGGRRPVTRLRGRKDELVILGQRKGKAVIEEHPEGVAQHDPRAGQRRKPCQFEQKFTPRNHAFLYFKPPRYATKERAIVCYRLDSPPKNTSLIL